MAATKPTECVGLQRPRGGGIGAGQGEVTDQDKARGARRDEHRSAGTGRPNVMDKGLKKNAIGFVSNIVIGVASTAPAYSVAATLGFIIADPGIASTGRP